MTHPIQPVKLPGYTRPGCPIAGCEPATHLAQAFCTTSGGGMAHMLHDVTVCDHRIVLRLMENRPTGLAVHSIQHFPSGQS